MFLRVVWILLAMLPLCAQVKVWEDTLTVPTYVAGPPDKNPFFYTGRTYQGARGEVYPYPMYDNLTDRVENKAYKALYLENEYVKICVLPELGGRIFSAVDKTNGYDFFYHQTVVKPALIGMLGAWISGGVEWNIPHHHRASSFMPVEYKTEENADGSKTIWVGEMELRHRMRWAVGLTLRPGRSTLEATVRAINRTPLAHSMLYFANVAVHTNDNYQVIFPPSTQFVTQHAKREFARWPVSDNIYNGIDFTKGVDVSMWKNHPSSISMFAWNYEDDFLAGYDHGKKAGTLHVADHHAVPGKKFFTWGSGPGGRMWDNILSDKDGPYLELMVGAYSDNQPDYSWLQPYEAKDVRQTWYPFHSIGGVKNANEEAAVNLDRLPNGKVKVGAYVTRARSQATLRVTDPSGRVVFTTTEALDPSKALVREIDAPAGTRLRVAVVVGGGELVAYEEPPAKAKEPLPPPVQPPDEPSKIKTAEELYLIGLRLEQFHNPALDPDPYYEEVLKRDPGDERGNLALGLLYLRKARYADAERLLRKAVDRVSFNYTRPKDSEPDYYLGLALLAQEKYKEAEDHLQRAAWSYAWQSPAYTLLSEIYSLRGQKEKSLEFAQKALVTNAWNTHARFLVMTAQFVLGQRDESYKERATLRAFDPLDPRGSKEIGDIEPFVRQYPSEGFELAADCMRTGYWDAAVQLLGNLENVSPLARYYRGWVLEKMGRKDEALADYKAAEAMSPDYVFPFQWEAEKPLRAAMAANPRDARAPYYLGNLMFDRQPDLAASLWEKARELDPKFPVVYRNLAVAYSREESGEERALALLEKALELNPNDGLYLFEWDRLAEYRQMTLAKRLAMFDKYPAAADSRDDVKSRQVALLVQNGKYDAAIAVLQKRHFHLWEGGVRFNANDAWTDAHLLRGRQRMSAKQYSTALDDFKVALEYPSNLEATRSYRGSRLPESLYFQGLALDALSRNEEAKSAWKASASQLLGTEENPHPTIDSGAALLYYQGRSLERLGDAKRAKSIYSSLIDLGKEPAAPRTGSNFFAKFGERGSAQMRMAQAHYLAGLGHLGLNEMDSARAELRKAVELNAYHLDARTQLQAIGN